MHSQKSCRSNAWRGKRRRILRAKQIRQLCRSRFHTRHRDRELVEIIGGETICAIRNPAVNLVKPPEGYARPPAARSALRAFWMCQMCQGPFNNGEPSMEKSWSACCASVPRAGPSNNYNADCPYGNINLLRPHLLFQTDPSYLPPSGPCWICSSALIRHKKASLDPKTSLLSRTCRSATASRSSPCASRSSQKEASNLSGADRCALFLYPRYSTPYWAIALFSPFQKQNAVWLFPSKARPIFIYIRSGLCSVINLQPSRTPCYSACPYIFNSSVTSLH